ncbi:MAG TPA: class D sortase [Bryobacteraceae bacterium]|nr:class D sortase [Bryobacteraceae bacterium]
MNTLFATSRHQRRRTLLIAEIALLTIGFVFLTWAGYMTARGIASNSWQNYRFEESLAGNQPSVTGYVKYLWSGDKGTERAGDEQPAMDAPASQPSARKRFAPNELIGRIEIPRLKVNAVVKEGANSKTLSRAVGHVPYTALPGEKGNVGVAAHRDTYFRGLRHVRHGDIIRVTTAAGVYLYEVDALKIVWPKNVEVLHPTPDRRITLVTCYPFNYVGSAPKRFIVQGKQIGFEELSARGKTRSEQAPSGQRVREGT